MENAPQKNEQVDGLEGKNHYGRDTFISRLTKLTNDAIGRPLAVFEAGVNNAGTDIEQLEQWINDPAILEDEKVEPFMRELSIIMSDLRMELGEGKSLDPQRSREIQDRLTKLIKAYFD